MGRRPIAVSDEERIERKRQTWRAWYYRNQEYCKKLGRLKYLRKKNAAYKVEQERKAAALKTQTDVRIDCIIEEALHDGLEQISKELFTDEQRAQFAKFREERQKKKGTRRKIKK